MNEPLTIAEASEASGIPKSTLRHYIGKGKLTAYKREGFKNGWRVYLADIEKMKELKPFNAPADPTPSP